jgi:aminobutyraldehyde dehydrogenase
MKLSTQLLIDGQPVTGDGQAEPILNPATGELLASVPEASFEQVNRAVNGAQRAFAQWSRTTPASRSTLLLRLADAIERHAEEFAALESLNCGKPYLAVLNDELPAVVDCFRFFAGAARCLQAAGGEYIEGHTSMIRRDPIGVVGASPLELSADDGGLEDGPVLAAGNTVVLKPSEQTPLTALRLAELASELFPRGVINIVCGRGESVGAPLVEHPLVRMVSLTGDIATGQKILQAPPAP